MMLTEAQLASVMAELGRRSPFFDEELSGDPQSSTTPHFFDDGFIHINRCNTHFVFYNGQGRGELTEGRLHYFVNMVEEVINSELSNMPLGEHGLTPEDQDFRATREDIEVHPSV